MLPVVRVEMSNASVKTIYLSTNFKLQSGLRVDTIHIYLLSYLVLFSHGGLEHERRSEGNSPGKSEVSGAA